MRAGCGGLITSCVCHLLLVDALWDFVVVVETGRSKEVALGTCCTCSETNTVLLKVTLSSAVGGDVEDCCCAGYPEVVPCPSVWSELADWSDGCGDELVVVAVAAGESCSSTLSVGSTDSDVECVCSVCETSCTEGETCKR